MNIRIPAGKGNPSTREPPTYNYRRRWRKEWKIHRLKPGSIWKYNSMVEKLLKTNNWTRVREKPQNHAHMEEPASTDPSHTCTTQYRAWCAEWLSVNQLEGRTNQRKTQQQSKPKDIQRANINDSPRTESSGDHGHYTTESHRSSTIEVHTQGHTTDQFMKQKLRRRVSQTIVRQRNNLQMKGKAKVSEC